MMVKERRRNRAPDEPSFRFDRIVLGVRITNRSGTREWRQFEKDNAILTSLGDQGQEETLRLFQRGKIKMPQLRAAASREQLLSGGLVKDMALVMPLWGKDGAFQQTLPQMGRSEASRLRYDVSMKSLERKAGEWLPLKATVKDLQYVNWTELADEWDKSGSDWNRLRGMLSAFLTKLLKDKFHPYRRMVLAAIPTADEVERVCEISVEQFWEIIASVDEALRPMYVTLVATGMRWGEYQRCKREHLNHRGMTVTVVGEARRQNAKKKRRVIHVADWLWPWVVAGVPHPLEYQAARRHWVKACKAHGVEVRIHDLRHLKGQVAIEGADISEVADVLGHSQLSTTRRYVRHANQERVAKVVGSGLKPMGKVLPMPKAAGSGR
jgi:integrase